MCNGKSLSKEKRDTTMGLARKKGRISFLKMHGGPRAVGLPIPHFSLETSLPGALYREFRKIHAHSGDIPWESLRKSIITRTSGRNTRNMMDFC